MPERKTSAAGSAGEGCPAIFSVAATGTAQPTIATNSTTATTAQRIRTRRVAGLTPVGARLRLSDTVRL